MARKRKKNAARRRAGAGRATGTPVATEATGAALAADAVLDPVAGKAPRAVNGVADAPSDRGADAAPGRVEAVSPDEAGNGVHGAATDPRPPARDAGSADGTAPAPAGETAVASDASSAAVGAAADPRGAETSAPAAADAAAAAESTGAAASDATDAADPIASTASDAAAASATPAAARDAANEAAATSASTPAGDAANDATNTSASTPAGDAANDATSTSATPPAVDPTAAASGAAAPAGDRPRAGAAPRRRAPARRTEVEAWVGAPRGLGIAGTARRPGAPGTKVVPTAPVVRHVGTATRVGIEAAKRATPIVPRPQAQAAPSASDGAGARPVVRVSLAQAAAAGHQTLRTASPVARVATPVAIREPAAARAPERRRREAPPVEPLALPAVEDAVLFAVEGMGTPACADRIERALRAVPGVEAVDANLAAGVVAVAPARVDRGAIEAALAAAGHPARAGGDAETERRRARRMGFEAAATAALGIAAGLAHDLLGAGAALAAGACSLALAHRVTMPALRHAARLRPSAELLPLAAAVAILAAAWLDGAAPALAAFPLAVHLAVAAIGARARARALAAIERLRGALPGAAGTPGARLDVPPGARFPADGRLVRPAVIDERPVGGEEDTERLAGELVIAGTAAPEGATLEVAAAGPARRLERGLQVAERALATRPVRTPAQIASVLLVPIAIAAALAAGLLTGPTGVAATLAAAAPLALAFAAALSAAAGIARAAERGAAVRSSEALERAAAARTVLFDRSPALTRGDAAVLELVTKPGRDPAEILALAAAAERGVDHGIARALAAHAADLRLEVPAATERRIEPGAGVSARVGGRSVLVGSARHFAARGIDPGMLGPVVAELATRGRIPVLIAIDEEAVAAIGIAETPRESARQAMGSLELLDVELRVASADATASVQWLAEAIGLDRRLARGDLDVEGKRALVEELRAEGPCLLVAGSPPDAALVERVDLAVAAGGGHEIEARAGALLLRPDPQGVVELVRAGRAARRGRRVATAVGLAGNAAAIALAITGGVGIGGAIALSLLTSAAAVGAAASPWIRVR